MFGELVRAHRRRLGMTQEELAGHTGLSVRGIGRLEGGRVAAPRMPTVRLLADAFDLSGPERELFCAAADPTNGGSLDQDPLVLPDEAAAWAWLDREHSNVMATQRACHEQGWHDATWQLAWALNTYHTRRGPLVDKLRSWRIGADAALRAGQLSIRSVAHRELGRCQVSQADPPAARRTGPHRHGVTGTSPAKSARTTAAAGLSGPGRRPPPPTPPASPPGRAAAPRPARWPAAPGSAPPACSPSAAWTRG